MIRHFVVTVRMWRGVTFAPGRFTAGPPAKYLRRACDQPLDTCPECREEKARNRGRTGDPTPIGTWKGLEQPKAPPTAEQLEELRIARKAMLPGAQAPQATDPKSGAA